MQDLNGNITFASESDWASSGGSLRSTDMAYYLGTSGTPSGTNADAYWNPGVGCAGSACILNLPKSKAVTYPNATREEFCYNAAGNLTLHARLKQGGSATPLANCSAGTVTSAAIGSWYTYGTHGNLLTALDPRGIQSRYQYDGESLYVTDKYEADETTVQRHWHYTTDRASGKVQTVTDVDNNVSTTTDYDVFGRPFSVTDPAKTTTTAYNDTARYKRTTTTGSGLTLDEVEYYDQIGRVVLTRRSENGPFGSIGSVQTDYNQTGNGIKVERRFENLISGRYEYISNPYRDRSGDVTRGVTRRQYDGAGRPIEEATFSGSYPVSEQNRTGTTTTSYSGPSHTVTDPAGKARTLTVDALGRLVKVVEAPSSESYQTSYTYDVQNDLTSVTQGSQPRTFVYDPLGRLTSATNPESGLTSYTYDDGGNLLTKTDALSVVTTMVYDPLNRVTSKSYSGGGTPAVTYTYDSCPQGKGRLCSVGNSVSTTNYTAYDALGRVTAGNQNTGGTAYPFSYAYNLLDGLTSMTYPSGRTVTYGYDLVGRVSGVNGYASSIQYAPHGAPSQVNLANGVTETTAYNSRLQPTSIAAGSLLTLGFGYGTTNNNGNVVSQTVSVPGASGTQSYSYDNLNRLSGASEAGAWSRTFGYDAYGNMWVDTNTGVAANSFTPRSGSWFNSSNRLVNGGLPIQFRDSGELQQIGGYTFTYDAESRLKTSTLNGATTTYSYDGEGRRVMKAVAGGATTTYVYDAMGKLAAEYGGTVDTGGTQYLTSDHLGSTRLVTNAGGNMVSRHDYLPFGEEIPAGVGFRTAGLGYTADAFPLKFTGKERDAESGLDYFGARYFSAAQGRSTSPDYTAQGSDPVPVPGADFDNPQSLNLYSYVRNSPLINVDADGHDCVVQTRNSETSETVSVTSGNCNKINVGDGQTKTYIAGMVDVNSIASNGSGGITFGYTPYSGGGGVADLNAAPIPDRPGIAYGWGNNAQGYQTLAAADRFITTTAKVYAGIYGVIGGAVVGGEIAAATAAARSGIIFRLAHGMRLALGHAHVLAEEGAIKNAIAAAIGSGAIQRMGASAFQGVVNVAGTYIKFTGAFTPSGVVVSNVMGAALQK